MVHRAPSILPLRGISPTPPGRGPSRTRGTLAFFGGAALTGIVFHILFVQSGARHAVQQIQGLRNWEAPGKEDTIVTSCPKVEEKLPDHDTASSFPGGLNVNSTATSQEDVWDLARVREAVSKTKGYYARDYSLGLGWNNMRYIIEASLLHANILNRTVVLPSFVYARACEFNLDACASVATMVNRGDAIGWSEWRDLPIEQQMGWRIPIEYMIDLPRLRKYAPVVTIHEYLLLHGLDPGLEWSNGAWDRNAYHQAQPPVSLHSIPNHEIDPHTIARIDHLDTVPAAIPGKFDPSIKSKLDEALGDKDAVIKWDKVKEVLGASLTEEELETRLLENDYVALHTWAGVLGMDFLKSVVEPVKVATPRSHLKGMYEDYNSINAEVLVLSGETHLGRKPGGLYFSTIKKRDDFARMVLHWLHPPVRVRKLADKIVERMHEKVGGRMWMSAHMRRGDFVRLNWAMEHTIEAHLKRVKERLKRGREILEQIATSKDIQRFDVPDVEPDLTQIRLDPPRDGDAIFVATDERDKKSLQYLKDNGALRTADLLTIEDRREFGWSIMVTDVLALLDQAVMAKGYYFYGHAMSSVAGGAVNMHAAKGADHRTYLID